MDRERLKYEGRRVGLRRDAKALELSCEAYRDQIRDKADPTIPVHELPGEEIANAALQLSMKLLELQSLKEQLAKIDDILRR